MRWSAASLNSELKVLKEIKKSTTWTLSPVLSPYWTSISHWGVTDHDEKPGIWVSSCRTGVAVCLNFLWYAFFHNFIHSTALLLMSSFLCKKISILLYSLFFSTIRHYLENHHIAYNSCRRLLKHLLGNKIKICRVFLQTNCTPTHSRKSKVLVGVFLVHWEQKGWRGCFMYSLFP